MFEAAQLLVQRARVVLFHSAPLPLGAHPGLLQADTPGLRDTLAALAACDYLITVDSAFFHVGAALAIPSLGIFGPTDGRLFSIHHPCAELIEASGSFACAPCWRNEDLPCHLTGRQVSVCLSSVAPQAVVEGFEALARRFPRTGAAPLAGAAQDSAPLQIPAVYSASRPSITNSSAQP
jgi:ADP-heptose:LPS heptosyltransferase